MSDTKRVVFTETLHWAAEVDTETAEMILDERADIIDIAETLTRVKRANPHNYPFDGSLTVEAADESFLYVGEWDVLDGTKPESFYWTARKHVMDARYALSSGRYREGDCREMDAVNAKLAKIEDELRLLAMAVDEERKTSGA